jgi:DNA polymerase-1
LVYDLECNGLLEEATQIHCLVLRDLETDSVLACANQPGYAPIEDGLILLHKAEKVYGHNSVAFDLPVIQKLRPCFKLKGKHYDTFLTASMRWAHIKESDYARAKKGSLPGNLIGSHSLEAWGYRLGVKKEGVDITDWSKWTPEMHSRCISDTAVTKALVERIRAAGVSPEAVETEHELRGYLFHQENNGWPFDFEAATKLQAKLAQRKEELAQELRSMFEPWQVSLGMFTPKRDDKKRGYVKGVAIERFKTVEFNPASRDHIASRLTALYGWEPKEFAEKGKPKVDEIVLKGLSYPPVPKLIEYLTVDKRLGQLALGKENWLNHATKDARLGGKLTGLYHIHGRVKQNHAVTHRAAHARPNMGQVPAVYSPYGKECRSLFMVPEGWVLMGADAASLEARCLAHRMAPYDGGAFGVSVLSEKPNDFHTINAGILSISRDTAKTFFYAFLYGAGDEKLGKIIKPEASAEEHKRIGAAARKKFLKGLPALKKLLEAVQSKAAAKGYLRLLDGRRCYTRSQHAALNSLLQGDGAVI